MSENQGISPEEQMVLDAQAGDLTAIQTLMNTDMNALMTVINNSSIAREVVANDPGLRGNLLPELTNTQNIPDPEQIAAQLKELAEESLEAGGVLVAQGVTPQGTADRRDVREQAVPDAREAEQEVGSDVPQR